MARPSAHNSILTLPIFYSGKSYASFIQLFREVLPPPTVGEVTLAARLRRGLKKQGCYEDGWLHEALHLDADAFRKKHGTRRTWVVVDGERLDLASTYDAIERTQIDYATFRQRLAKRTDLTMDRVKAAATLDFAEWNTHYGRGGRRKDFTYAGDLHPEAHGKYTAVTSLLKAIGRYDDRETIKHRLKRGWDIDDALCMPAI